MIELGGKCCTTDGCARPGKARGLCMHHYGRAHRAGEFATKRQAKAGLSLAERFAFIGWDVNDAGCWLWRGATRNGYGRIGRAPGANHDVLAHRVSYVVRFGPIAVGMFVHHRCADRRCVNPDHLELTTARENIGEMMERAYYVARIKELEHEVATLRTRVASLPPPRNHDQATLQSDV